MEGTLLGTVLGFVFNLIQQWVQSRTPQTDTTGTNGNVTDGETCVSGNDDALAPADVPSVNYWLDVFRGSIRPVITIGFFFAWFWVKGVLLAFAIWQEPAAGLLPVFWGTEDEILFSTVLSYWFSSRMWRMRAR